MSRVSQAPDVIEVVDPAMLELIDRDVTVEQLATGDTCRPVGDAWDDW